MGTNFYLFSNNKEAKNYIGMTYNIVDEPNFRYELHIAKTSHGWLPLFQKNDVVKSVKDIKRLYDTGLFKIIDENLREYTWPQFEERVLKWNGGVAGAVKTKLENINPESALFKPHHETVPISHFEYENGKYAYMYSKDEQGYEFCDTDFS